MGSVQQVAMASICLVAAFGFGCFINQMPTDQAAQTDSASPDSMRSLIEPELTVQKIPGTTPLLKPKLKARLPMPSLANSATKLYTAEEIPPPSDLSGRIKTAQNRVGNSFSMSSEPNGIVADAPTFGRSAIGDSSMPVINKRNLDSSPNLADSMRAPSQPSDFDVPVPTVKNAPVFAATEFNSQAPPADQRYSQSKRPLVAPTIAKAPSLPNLRTRSQPIIAAKPSIGPARDSARPTTRDPGPSFETATRDQFRYSNPQRIDTNRPTQSGLMPIPPLNQTVTIDDPGRAFGNRDSVEPNPRENAPQSSWANTTQSVLDNNNSDHYREPSQTQQPRRRVARLPLQLNSTAQTKLARLRDDAIRKISLGTTQFSEYVVKRGDSLQSIASQYFGKPDYYLDIYLANRDRLRFPGDLREGMSIKIPVYQQ